MDFKPKIPNQHKSSEAQTTSHSTNIVDGGEGQQTTQYTRLGRVIVQLPITSGVHATQLLGKFLSPADNRVLHSSLLELMAGTRSANVSNKGGWHSGADGHTDILSDFSGGGLLAAQTALSRLRLVSVCVCV